MPPPQASSPAPRPIRDVLRGLGRDSPDEEADGALRRLPLGDFLVARGLVTQADVTRALAEQRRYPGRRLGEILVDLDALSEIDLARALAAKFHLPFVDLSQCVIDPLNVAAAIATHGRVLPVDLDGTTITVAVADPLDADVADAIRLQTRRDVRVVLAPASQLAGGLGPGGPVFRPSSSAVATNQESLEEVVAAVVGSGARPHDGPGEAAPGEDPLEGSVVDLVDRMLADAYAAGASDVHVEPDRARRRTRIRFRVDGECRVYRELQTDLSAPLVARLKILSDLDISERRRPQDGKMRFRAPDGQPVELRVAVVPTAGANEDLVLRLLPPSTPRPIEQMGMNARDLHELRRIMAAPYGLILCVGPTGSGKTTTLHSVLSALNAPDTKIWTAEDPVEITQEGLRQVQVNRKIGFDFAAAMRAFLRADPDIIMVGEMRDAETASTAVTASLTGHLVLSTLHTNNAPETVARLLDMGLDPFAFSDALLGVIAQRLARALCRSCRVQVKATATEAETILSSYGGVEALRRDLGVDPEGLAIWHAVGCPACEKTGYKGRTAIHELLTVNDDMRHAIASRATADELRSRAIAGGMRTLLQNGTAKALAGATDMRQVMAVCSR